MILRKRHRSRIKPAVDNFGRTFHRSAALAFEGQIVDIRAVKFHVPFHAAQFFEFRFASDHVYFAAIGTYPYRKRCTPISVTRKPPVDHVFKEVAHSARFNGFRHPVYGIVGFDQLVLDCGNFNEPALSRIVKKRRIAAPAMRVTVFIEHFLEQKSLFFQKSDHALIRLFDEYTRKIFYGRHKIAALVDEIDDGQTIFFTDTVVIFTKRGRDMNDTRAVRKCYIIVADNIVRFFTE